MAIDKEGHAGFGLRRMLIDQSGEHKGVLSRGEQKSLQTDRVILVKGPDEESKTVQWIYSQFVNEGKQEREIAISLNERGIQTDLGRDWNRGTVRQILTNEKYIGNNVYNRISFKLKKRRVRNPADMLVRKDDAFEAVVPQDLFYTAQGIIRERNRCYSNAEMIDRLKKLMTRKDTLTASLIDSAEGMPTASTYRSRLER